MNGNINYNIQSNSIRKYELTITQKTLTSYVAEVLREKIISHEIKSGQPLRQDALAAELNVSRIPVREALMQLEVEGLVSL
jgi:DNA-binding GntR family transcriptional regulator